MKTITDKNGKEWALVLNCGDVCDRILEDTGVDLLEPEEHAEGLYGLQTRSRLTQKFVWAIVKPDAEQAGVQSLGEFFAKFDSMVLVKKVVAELIADFIQQTDEMAAIRLEQTKIADERAQKELMATLQSEELHETVQLEVKQKLKTELDRLREKISESVAGSGQTDKQDTCGSA